jgi:hypothetical protein
MPTHLQCALTGMDADETIGVDDSFFDVGGTSLLAGQLAAAMRKRFGITMGVSDVFSSPTVKGMSDHVSEQTKRTYNKHEDGGGDGPSRAASPSGALRRRSTGRPSLVSLGGLVGLVRPTSAMSRRDSTPKGADTIDEGDDSSPASQKSLMALVVQIMPLAFWSPLRRALVWICFVLLWASLLGYGWHRFFALVVSIVITRLAARIVLPLVGIAFKW